MGCCLWSPCCDSESAGSHAAPSTHSNPIHPSLCPPLPPAATSALTHWDKCFLWLLHLFSPPLCHQHLCSAPRHGEKVTVGLGGGRTSFPAEKVQGFWCEIHLYWLSCAQLRHPKPHVLGPHPTQVPVPRRSPFPPRFGHPQGGPRGHMVLVVPQLGASSLLSPHATALGGLVLPGNVWKPLGSPGTLNQHWAPGSSGDHW